MTQYTQYVRRCKNKDGLELHRKLHVCDSDYTYTLCGKPLDHMWSIVDGKETVPEDITCAECKKVFYANNKED